MSAFYDLQGRQVDGLVPAGNHQIMFDARDNFGNPLGSGMLFCRMQARDHVKTIKLELSR
jgi:hypothetical protein